MIRDHEYVGRCSRGCPGCRDCQLMVYEDRLTQRFCAWCPGCRWTSAYADDDKELMLILKRAWEVAHLLDAL